MEGRNHKENEGTLHDQFPVNQDLIQLNNGAIIKNKKLHQNRSTQIGKDVGEKVGEKEKKFYVCRTFPGKRDVSNRLVKAIPSRGDIYKRQIKNKKKSSFA